MPGILDALLGTKYADKRKEDETKFLTYGPILHDYMTNPNSAVNPDVAGYGAKQVMSIMGPKERKNFQAFWDTVQHGRQLSAQQAQLAQKPPQFPQGSPAPQAAMSQPSGPAGGGIDPNAVLSANGVPGLAPPPQATASPLPTTPLPGSSAGQPGSGAPPAVPSDTTAPQPLPGIQSDPGQGWTSLGITSQTTAPITPPPSQFNGQFLRAMSPLQMQQMQEPAVLAKAKADQKIYADRFEYLRKQGLNDTQIVNILGGHPGAYEPIHASKPGEEFISNSGKLLYTNQQPRIVNTPPGGASTAVPVVNQGASGIAAPPGQPTTIAAPPPLLPRATLAAKQAFIASMKAKNPSYEWSDTDLPKAIAMEKELSMSPTEILMKQTQLANLDEVRAQRRLAEQNLALHIREFQQTKGPEAIDGLADQIYSNPETVKKLTGDIYNLVAQRYTQKYHLPMPRELPGADQQKEDASKLSLNHIAGIRELLKNPVLQKRLGAFNGRVGNLEQQIGTTVGLSEADARAIQQFRTRLPYLFGQEARSVLGGRPAQKFMDDLKAASPGMRMGLPLFLGALDGMEAMGKLNVLTAEQTRNGGTANVRPEIQQQYGMQAPPNSQGPPPPPKVGEVRDGHRFKGGNPGLPSNWERIQ